MSRKRTGRLQGMIGGLFLVWGAALGMAAEVSLSAETMVNPGDGLVPAGSPIHSSPALTLQDAVALALSHHPELQVLAWDLEAARARKEQAALLPNPELEAEFEDFAGTGELAGTDASEIKVGLSQRIELGGKRSKRVEVGDLTAQLSLWDYEAKRLDVIASVRTAFFDLLEAQERVALLGESLGVAERMTDAVSERVKAGKVSPIEETKAAVAMETARVVRQRAESARDTARSALAAHWGAMTPSFEKAMGSLEALNALPSLSELEARVAHNPDLARWPVELRQKEAALALEASKGVPDVVLSGAVRYANEIDEHAFSAGVSIPLPLLNRNQGARRQARHRLSQAAEAERAAEVRVRQALFETYHRLKTARTTVEAMRQHLLPGAEQAFQATGEGYRQGKFSYLDLLDAQRTLFEVKHEFLAALGEFHRARAALDRLTGQPFQPSSHSLEDSNHDQ